MTDLETAKFEICDIGDRLYKRGFAAANDGNITYRLEDGRILCTPTMHCKGFLVPADICEIDAEGKQLAGEKTRSSEALLHLEIMRARPDVRCVVHCHPPHATAFAVAHEAIPQGVLPEVELFLGEVPISRYETPGGKAFAETILPFVERTNVVVLANHGTVSWGESLERAYWWTEILDAYCRILILAKQIGHVEYLSAAKTRELVDLKVKWGFGDPRLAREMQDIDPRKHAVFGSTWSDAKIRSGAFGNPTGDCEVDKQNADALAALKQFDAGELEALVTTIVRRVVDELLK